jgi:DNA-binding NtrC family response regulator
MEGKKVLVIDDERVVLESVSKILTSKDYQVDTSLSGRDGLRRATEGEYDIVLTDIRMPDVGGMRVLRDLKRARPSLPVIMITGYASIKSAVQAIKLGAAHYLEKPFTPEELLSAVALALEKAFTREPEEQDVIHKGEIIRVLERAASDNEFFTNLLEHAVDALDEYDLTGPEKLAILTRDISWIAERVGPLTRPQRRWLELRRVDDRW